MHKSGRNLNAGTSGAGLGMSERVCVTFVGASRHKEATGPRRVFILARIVNIHIEAILFYVSVIRHRTRLNGSIGPVILYIRSNPIQRWCANTRRAKKQSISIHLIVIALRRIVLVISPCVLQFRSTEPV